MRPPTENTDDQYTDPRTPTQQAALDALPQAMARFHASGREAKQLPSCTYGAKLVGIRDRTQRSSTTFVLVIEGQEQGRGAGSSEWSRIDYSKPSSRTAEWEQEKAKAIKGRK